MLRSAAERVQAVLWLPWRRRTRLRWWEGRSWAARRGETGEWRPRKRACFLLAAHQQVAGEAEFRRCHPSVHHEAGTIVHRHAARSDGRGCARQLRVVLNL